MSDADIIKWFLRGVAIGGAIVYVFWMMFYRDQIAGINNGR